MIRQLTTRLLKKLVPEPQARLLLRAGATGAQTGGFGLALAWDHWRAPVARKWTAALTSGAGHIRVPGDHPRVDLAATDPISAITSDAKLSALADFFNVPDPVAPALVSAHTQALLYTLVRNLRPEYVVEIGTYRLSTSWAICLALHANGHGLLHTVDPYDRAAIFALLRRWPSELRARVCYHPVSSMEFFTRAVNERWTSDLVFVDGKHDYEYALFDILAAARMIRPGGFIAIDNISQAGPAYAARDFMRDRADWRECGHSLAVDPRDKAFDLGRSTIANTDLCVIRGPSRYVVGPRAKTSGPQWVDRAEIEGFELSISRPASGMLHAQYIVRVVRPQPFETVVETRAEFAGATGTIRVALPWAFEADDMTRLRSVELWLGWSGENDLELNKAPVPY